MSQQREAACSVATLARTARQAQLQLGAAAPEMRTRVLESLGRLLEERESELVAANQMDLERAVSDQLAPALLQRLKLTSAKLETLVDGVRQLAAADDPVGREQLKTQLDDGLVLTRVSSPIGVLLVVFESRPDAVIQIGSLALRTGNGVLLKGGSEAQHSNRALARCLQDALSQHELPAAAVHNVETRQAVHDLLACDEDIDLVIPRGSSQLVRSIQQSTRIPVLGHAEGICHLFLDAAADPAMATAVTVDAKCDYPSVCNAVETLLVHRRFLPQLPPVLEALQARGVELRVEDELMPLVQGACRVREEDWSTEYCDLILSVRVVDDLDQAIEHIHRWGSGHTEAIVTQDEAVAEAFLARVDAASVFVNASTRFADGYRYGLGAEVGISTGRIHARGPVGIDGLLTCRWLLRGHGHCVAEYTAGARSFTHTPLPL